MSIRPSRRDRMMPIVGDEPFAAMERTFGRYEVLFPIARGGMGEVIAVRLRREHGFVQYFALKRMREDLARVEDLVDVFLDEARLSASIASPHVVPVVDVGRDDLGVPFLTMELVVGADLRTLRQKKIAISTASLVEIGAQAAMGLDAAHRATDARGRPLEIVHRDVSPQNLLVGADGRVRVTDFGIARARSRLAASTQVGLMKGKLGYTAPEQLEGHVDARVDVWALGVVLWEIVTGRPLFSTKNVSETLRNVRERPVPSLDTLDPRVPPALAAVIARTLERDRDRRHPSGAALAADLRALVRRGAVRAVAAGELASLGARGGTALSDDLRMVASASLPELTPVPAVLLPARSGSRRAPPPLPPRAARRDFFEAETSVRAVARSVMPASAVQTVRVPWIDGALAAPSIASAPTFTPVVPHGEPTSVSGTARTARWPEELRRFAASLALFAALALVACMAWWLGAQAASSDARSVDTPTSLGLR